MSRDVDIHSFKFGYLGSSTGAAAAAKAATQKCQRMKTIVSRAGRLDLVDAGLLAKLTSSILILVG